MEEDTPNPRHNYRILIDLSRCIGKASCVDLAPGIFRLKEKGPGAGIHSMVYNEQGADWRTVILAAKSCPTYAIILIDKETEKQIHPYPPRD